MWSHRGPSPLLDLELVEEPPIAPISLDTAKSHLRVDYDDDDGLIETCIAAATAQLDGWAGFMGRGLVRQQWTLYLDDFPKNGFYGWLGFRRFHSYREILLPLSPLISVDSVRYADPDGNAQTLDAATYVVRTGPRSSFELKRGNTWPLTSRDPRAVAITFTVGFAASPPADGDVTDVPAPIRQAMLLMIGDMYENREAIVVAESRVTQIVNPTANNLLAPLRASWL